MNWFAADYVVFAVGALAGVVGLFIGFSGALAFLAATVIGALVGKLGWDFSAGFLVENWSRGLVTLLASIIVFGLVRWLVKKFVNGLLRQPADSIFGCLTAGITGMAVAVIVVYLINFFNIAEIRSTLVSGALDLV